MPGKIFVPNEYNSNAKILFVGESPGEQEEFDRKPFVGDAGQLLTSTLMRYGNSRNEVSLANLSGYRPAINNNKFELLLGTPQLEEGQSELLSHIEHNDYNVIVPLGKEALKLFTGKSQIMAYRGSILSYKTKGGKEIKVIPTVHPSAVLRDRLLLPVFDGDLARIISDSKYPDLNLPERRFIIDPRGYELEECVEMLCNAEHISVDIESVKNSTHILCVGFAASPDTGICIVHRTDGETQNAISRILSSRAKKVFHFGTFDTEMLYLNGYETKNYYWDTLVGQHVLNAELPRGLDFLTSIYTREPYYKASGRGEIPGDTKAWGSKVDKEKLWIYNCRDVCVTIEIFQEQVKELSDEADKRIFAHEMKLIGVGQSMSRNGMFVDTERRTLMEKALVYRWDKLQAMMEVLCGEQVNVRSPKLKNLLYDKFKLPVRKNRDGGVTTDEDAIVSLIGYTLDHINSLKTEKAINEWKVKFLILKAILDIRGLRQLLSNSIRCAISLDDRFRSTYKYSNVDTGRGASEGYVDGTGGNGQNFSRGTVDIPEGLDQFVARPLILEEENIPEGEFEIIDEPAEQGGVSLIGSGE